MLARRLVVPRAPPLGVRHMSRIGAKSVPVPSSVQITLESYPVEELRPIKPFSKKLTKYAVRHRPSKASFQAFGTPSRVRVDGPLGSLMVPVHSFCRVEHSDEALDVKPQCGGETNLGRTLWGYTRSCLANAVHGVSQGFTKELELQGVGYRARVETVDISEPWKPPTPMPPEPKGPKKGKAVVERVVDKPLGTKSYERRTRGAQAGTVYMPPETPPAPERQALILRVGFSHEVRMIFPPHLTVATPSPTQIVISGIDRQQVGQAASRIKLIRKPDAYKGKGVRYAGEVIKLKPGKRR